MLNIKQEEIDNELRAVNKLCKSEHPNIVQVFQAGALIGDSSVYFIDMELCDFTLKQYSSGEDVPFLPSWHIVRERANFQESLYQITNQIVDGLIFIHENQEVHRDLCPSNGSAF